MPEEISSPKSTVEISDKLPKAPPPPPLPPVGTPPRREEIPRGRDYRVVIWIICLVLLVALGLIMILFATQHNKQVEQVKEVQQAQPKVQAPVQNAEIETLKKQATDLQQLLKRVIETHDGATADLQQQVANLRREHEVEVVQKTQTETKVPVQNAEIETLRKQVTDLRQQLKRSTEAHEKDEKDSYNKQIADLQRQVSDLREKLDGIRESAVQIVRVPPPTPVVICRPLPSRPVVYGPPINGPRVRW